jgi:O-antigen ligase
MVSGGAIGASLERLAFCFFWAFVWLLPSEEHFPLLGGFLLSRWVGLGALFLTLLRIVATMRMRRPGVLHYLMAATVVWAGMSLAWSLDPDSTISRIVTYLQLLVMVWMIWVFATTAQRVRSLLLAYVLGSCAPALSTVRDFFGGRNLTVEYAEMGYTVWDTARYAAAGINANDLGLLLALGVPMALYLLARSRSKIIVMVCWLQLALASTATLLTGSRGGMISLAVAFSMFPLIVPAMPRLRKRLSMAMLAGVLAGSAYIVPPQTWDRLLKVGSELTGGTLTHRTLIWAAGWDVFREHPLLGVGSGAYPASVQTRLDIAIVAHNSFLSVLVELGVIGALLLAGLLGSMFYSAARLPYLEKWLWIVLLLTWTVGASSLTWEYRKATWFLLGMLAAQVGCPESAGAAYRWRRSPEGSRAFPGVALPYSAALRASRTNAPAAL